MASSSQEKTEQPTGKRLGQAKDRGQIAKSRDFVSVAVLFVGSVAVYLSAGLIFEQFRHLIELMWNKDAFTVPGYFTSSGSPIAVLNSFCLMLAPPLLAMLTAAVLANMAQTKGFVFSPKALRFSFSNLSPLGGMKRLVSLRSLTELVKSFLKLIIVSYAVYSVMWPERATLAELAGQEISDVLSVTGTLGLRIIFRVTAVMLILSLLDFLYQKWQTRKDLMMTRQEVKEEGKQSEGNPQIKSRIRTLQRSLARQRMLSKVPKASVIITNPTHYAVALVYTPGMEAPRVAAKGMNFIAQRIIGIGRKHGVPIIQNPPLARALYKQVKLEETIPVALYKAVAKILAYIYQQRQPTRRNLNG
ncbi:MAG: flagellar biosynthesis protein FlhB [Syntrophobacteraceae bacterium]